MCKPNRGVEMKTGMGPCLIFRPLFPLYFLGDLLEKAPTKHLQSLYHAFGTNNFPSRLGFAVVVHPRTSRAFRPIKLYRSTGYRSIALPSYVSAPLDPNNKDHNLFDCAYHCFDTVYAFKASSRKSCSEFLNSEKTRQQLYDFVFTLKFGKET